MIYKLNPKTLKSERYDILPFYRWILILVCMTSLLAFKRPEVITKIEHHSSEMIVNIKGIEFSPENLMAYIKMCGIRFSDIVYAQAVLETGGFKSMIFLESFNLFGMKVASSRPTTALSKSRGHALYDSWMMSVNDYALYQSAFLRDIRTSEDYLSYLSKHYAEDPAYVSKLRKIISKL